MRLWLARLFYVACCTIVVLQVLTYFLGYSSVGEFLWGPIP